MNFLGVQESAFVTFGDLFFFEFLLTFWGCNFFKFISFLTIFCTSNVPIGKVQSLFWTPNKIKPPPPDY